jgi:AcrR family transcriptional regulator
MTGRPNPGRRSELLEQILGYLETNALSSISMRRLAQALGVSTFTLTYQFNSQEELMTAIRGAAGERLKALAGVLETAPKSVFAYAEGVRRFWTLAQTAEYSTCIRVEMEESMLRVLGPEAANPCGRAWHQWRSRLVDAMVSLGVQPSVAVIEAEVSLASTFGLLYAAISSPGENFAASFDYALSAHAERVLELVGASAESSELSNLIG